MFFEISQNSHENTCARGLRPATLLKKETLTQVFFCEFPNSMTQRGEKLDSPVLSLGDFWMVWICRGILCFHSYFSCLETTLIREQLDENDFRRYIFSPKVSFWELWYTVMITAMFKVLYQQSRVNLTTAFERHLTTEYFMDIGVKLAPRHLTYYCMLLFLSNKPSFWI